MKASVFIGTSLDGFIARTNGDLDFLPPGGGWRDHHTAVSASRAYSASHYYSCSRAHWRWNPALYESAKSEIHSLRREIHRGMVFPLTLKRLAQRKPKL
jgi:hypothetical protein